MLLAVTGGNMDSEIKLNRVGMKFINTSRPPTTASNILTQFNVVCKYSNKQTRFNSDLDIKIYN